MDQLDQWITSKRVTKRKTAATWRINITINQKGDYFILRKLLNNYHKNTKLIQELDFKIKREQQVLSEHYELKSTYFNERIQSHSEFTTIENRVLNYITDSQDKIDLFKIHMEELIFQNSLVENWILRIEANYGSKGEQTFCDICRMKMQGRTQLEIAELLNISLDHVKHSFIQKQHLFDR